MSAPPLKRGEMRRAKGLKNEIDLDDNTRKVLATLLPEEEQVLRMRLTGHTVGQAAKQLGVTNSQIRRVEAKARRKLGLFVPRAEIGAALTPPARVVPRMEPSGEGKVMEQRYNLVYFRPWIGKNYKSPKLVGTRLLVVGESHYVDPTKPPPGPDLTEDVVRWHHDGDKRAALFTKIAQTVIGNEEVDQQAFWEDIAFYNYVQEPAADRPGKAPTQKMFAGGRMPFFEVLSVLQPKHALALGQRLWCEMPEFEGDGDSLIVESSEIWYGQYQVRGSHCLAGGINHPSSRGFSWCHWHPVVARFLQLAPEPNDRLT